MDCPVEGANASSPVSDGGRGLKLCVQAVECREPVRSPVSDGGRGLKLLELLARSLCAGFARQRWRAWIETFAPYTASRASRRFARQRWRAWIETSVHEYLRAMDAVRPSAMAGVD